MIVLGGLALSACGWPLFSKPSATTRPQLAETLVVATDPLPQPARATDDPPARLETVPLTPTGLPSPTPVPILRSLTRGGCCAQPFWSPDGQRVLFLDKPSLDAPAGIWGVDLEGGEARLFTDRLGIYSADFSLRAFPLKGQTFVERLADGERWVIPDGGRSVSFSPDGTLLAWVSGASGPPFDTAQRQIWVSHVDGSEARLVQTVPGGGLSGWFQDGRLLVNGRLQTGEDGQALWALNLWAGTDDDAQPVELARAARLRNAMLSPDGNWLAYVATFSADSAQDGLWLVNTRSLERRKLEIFGAFRWRDGERLLVIPLDLALPVHRLWQYHIESAQMDPLTDPAITPLRIANGDWSVSPDGNRLIFVSALDYNIWLLTLP